MGGQRRDEFAPVEFLPQRAQIPQNQRITIPINLCLLCLLWPFPHEVSQEFRLAKGQILRVKVVLHFKRGVFHGLGALGDVLDVELKQYRASLATRNTADFEACGLKLINPWL